MAIGKYNCDVETWNIGKFNLFVDITQSPKPKLPQTIRTTRQSIRLPRF